MSETVDLVTLITDSAASDFSGDDVEDDDDDGRVRVDLDAYNGSEKVFNSNSTDDVAIVVTRIIDGGRVTEAGGVDEVVYDTSHLIIEYTDEG